MKYRLVVIFERSFVVVRDVIKNWVVGCNEWMYCIVKIMVRFCVIVNNLEV